MVESILRYQSFAGAARGKICRVEVPELQLTWLHNCLDRLWNEREEYIYNTPAALASLVHLRPSISRAYTCVTFVQKLLARYELAGVTEADRPTVRALERRLTPYVIYEGPGPDHHPLRRLYHRPPLRTPGQTGTYGGELNERQEMGREGTAAVRACPVFVRPWLLPRQLPA